MSFVSFLLAALVVVVFALVLERLELPDRARETGRRARESLDVLRDPSLDDLQKEEALQEQARRLFGLLGALLGGSLLALGLPLLAVWLLELAGVSSLAAVLGVLERPDFLLGTVVVGTGGYLAYRRWGSP